MFFHTFGSHAISRTCLNIRKGTGGKSFFFIFRFGSEAIHSGVERRWDGNTIDHHIHLWWIICLLSGWHLARALPRWKQPEPAPGATNNTVTNNTKASRRRNALLSYQFAEESIWHDAIIYIYMFKSLLSPCYSK